MDSKEHVIIKNDNIGRISIKDLEKGGSLKDLSKKIFKEDYKRFIGARINNSIKNLNTSIKPNEEILYIGVEDVDGARILTRTVTAIFIMACKRLYPDRTVKVENFINSGLYMSFEGDYKINFRDIDVIKKEMQKIIDEDYPIYREKYSWEEAIDLFEGLGDLGKVRLLKTLDKNCIDIYTIGDYKDTFHGYLAPSTSYVDKFDIKYYYPGLLLLFPNDDSPNEIPEFIEQEKLAEVFEESNRWAEILDLEYLASLNEKIENGEIYDVIRISEALQEKKIAKIADKFCKKENKSIILIAGPSSSGKTTFANRLAVHLKVNGKRPIIISVDDYFVNREDTPLNEDGTYDFEAVEAIDLKKLNSDLIKLLEGERIELPKFNFLTGKQEQSGKYVSLDTEHPIIMEGIHCLNPRLTNEIPEKNKYKIYISPLSHLNIDSHNRIPTTDIRLIRRMVRDYKYRGNDSSRTLELWEGVRRGEKKHIFPFQKEADIVFNSALVYELAVLKKHIVPLLEKVEKDEEYFSEARKLLRFLEYFKDIEKEDSIPVNSLLREFIGGMDLNVH